jgi:hypothetical protein
MENYEGIIMQVCPQDIPDCYDAYIPSQENDGEVQYYIQAIDLTGRFETLPMAGYFRFDTIGGTPTQSGDVNMDGQINVLDIVVTVNYVLGLDTLTEYQTSLADINSDGTVNILDIISIVNIIIG